MRHRRVGVATGDSGDGELSGTGLRQYRHDVADLDAPDACRVTIDHDLPVGRRGRSRDEVAWVELRGLGPGFAECGAP